MLQCVARMCSKRRHVRLLCLLGHLLRGVSLRSNRGDLRVRGRILGQKTKALPLQPHKGANAEFIINLVCKSGLVRPRATRELLYELLMDFNSFLPQQWSPVPRPQGGKIGHRRTLVQFCKQLFLGRNP